MRVSSAGVALALVALSSGCKKSSSDADAPVLHVAAASDLADAFRDVGAAFTKSTGTPVTFSFAATGLLAKQITEGAPFEVFAAANVSFVDDVVKSGACFGDSEAKYATGHIAIWTKGDAGFAPQSLADLARPEIVHVAIANPEHAPYGKAAREALQASGTWASIEKKIVYGENVQQTLQFAQSGNAEVAIISQSLASRSGGRAVLVESSLHQPIDQAIVACKGAPSANGKMVTAARSFATFVASPAGRAILAQYGFGPPGEPSARAP